MAGIISFELLKEALSPVPRDFENLDISKTYEKEVDGKIHVGFVAYILFDSGEDVCSVFRDEGHCIFTLGDNFHDDCISENEENIPIDDPCIPKHIREKWIDTMNGRYEEDEMSPALKKVLVEIQKNN